MQHLIDSLQCKVPLLIILSTLFLTELLYLLGMPLIFDFYDSFKVLLNIIIVCQLMFLLLMRNQIAKLSSEICKLSLNRKYSSEEFRQHVRTTTQDELARLITTEAFQSLQQRPIRHSPRHESLEEEDTSSDEEDYPRTSHQLATKKKLF